MLNADSESMFLNDLFGDGLDTDAVLQNTGGLGLVGHSDPASGLNDFDMPDSPDNLTWAGDDTPGLVDQPMASAANNRPMQTTGLPTASQGATAGAGPGRAGKPPSNRSGAGGGRRRNSAAAQAAQVQAAQVQALAQAAGGEGEDMNGLNPSHTHVDVNVNTDHSHTRISVTTGQVVFLLSAVCHLQFLLRPSLPDSWIRILCSHTILVP